MKTYRLAENLSMVDVEPSIPGWTEFICPYVFGTERVALVDVGPSASAGNLIKGLKELDVNPNAISYILLTHIHIDHAGAIGELLEFLPNARVIVHPKGMSHLTNTEKLWESSLKTLGDLAEKYGQPRNIASERILPAEDGMRIKLEARLELEVIHTPGHAAHHLSFSEAASGVLFAGEACGVYIGKVDLLRPATPPPLILEQAIDSIDRLLRHKPTTIYYGHFGSGGDAQTKLQQYKEQLKLWEKVIREALMGGAESEAIFSELVERDAMLEGLKKLPQDQYQRERYFINNSIKGFVGYLTKS